MPRPRRRTRQLLAAATLWLAASAAAAETITVAGTGAALGTMRILAAEFARVQTAHSITVIPNLGSSGGVKALAAGAIDVAAIARPLRPEEAAQGLVTVAYGKTPLVIATNAKAAGTFANLAELADIYSGRRTTWAEGTPIRLVMRSPMTPITLALVRTEKRNVRILPLNGVVPSARTLADGSYPYAKEMQLARRKNPETAAVTRFFEFVASPQGRRILAETGHWVADTPTGR
jgi:phosphate transport system substrate-binding protein